MPFIQLLRVAVRRKTQTSALAGQVGAFPHYGGRWAEWNGGFRDTARQFIKGSEGPWAAAFAQSVCGSPNLYGVEQPVRSHEHLSVSSRPACSALRGCVRGCSVVSCS